jgi:hypothetical protein
VKFPVNVTTCPSLPIAVSDAVVSGDTVPARLLVISRSKQLELSICSAPPVVESAWLMPPAIENGFAPVLDVALNCQFPAMFGAGRVAGDVVAGGVEAEIFCIGAGDSAPHRRTPAKIARMLANRFMSSPNVSCKFS